MKHIRKLIMLAILLAPMAIGGTLWAQAQVSNGLYYIKIINKNAPAYMCPALEDKTTGQPYLSGWNTTTFNETVGGVLYSFDATYFKWVIKQVTINAQTYYLLINIYTDKYLVWDTYSSGTARAVHLETKVSEPTQPNDFCFYSIYVDGSDYYIHPDQASTNTLGLNYKGDFLATDLLQHRDGNYRGLIQFYTGTKNVLESAPLLTAPTINAVNAETSKVTVSDNNGLPSGYNIRYTVSTDGNAPANPTATSPIMSVDGYTVTEPCIIKAVIERYGVVLTDVAVSTTLNPSFCATPVINFDYATSMVSIACATPGVTIYYTTNGDTPTTGSTEYSGSIPVAGGCTIKAIATHTNWSNSAVAELTISQVATPTIQNNGSNAVSITTTTPGANIYYTLDGRTPTTLSSEYTVPLRENVSGVTIKAIATKENMIPSEVGTGSVTLKCEAPVITRDGNSGFQITCPFPASGVTIYYTTNGNDPTTESSSILSGGTVSSSFPVTVKAFAVATNYDNSTVTTTYLTQGMGGDGSVGDPYTIEYQSDVADFVDKANTPSEASKHYKVIATGTLDFSGAAAITQPFSGTFDGGTCILTGLSHPIFNTIDGGTVKNVTLKGVNINSSLDTVGAITCIATGNSRIYNCGILPNSIDYPEGTHPTVTTSSNCAGGLVGSLRDNSRVINCYSYADVSASSTASSTAAGIVGNNNEATTMTNLKTMVMNCMFYGNITDASTKKPVYGGQIISNAGASGVNGYNYYRNGNDVTFDDNYSAFSDYYCSLPADEEYLTRFEYYRSIFNSNKRLCAWWIGGTSGTAPTDAEVEAVGLAKWVLDPETAPFPILKKWGKYPSVINKDPDYIWNPETLQKVSRASAGDYQGKKLGTISVTVNAGAKHAGTGATSTTLSTVVVTDMDTLNHDYGYYKIQLPYYNELFGDPNADAATNWDNRYAGNYKDYVVTGWKITSIEGGTAGSFKGYSSTAGANAVSAANVTPDVIDANASWEDGFNFADRNCKNKDLYSKSGRVFAQGGYYYVPEGVTGITIEAYWGKAVYLHNKDHYMDRVNVAATADGDGSGDGTAPDFGSAFTPAGTLSTTFQGGTVRTSLQDAITNLPFTGTSYTVYDQAIVLVGNVQVKNRGGSLGRAHNNNGSLNKPFTIMSCDLDFDNEPDYCLQFQQRNTTNRPGVHPMRFDFLPVPELGLAIRTNTFAYAIGLMVPQGHFEITETSFMHTTQFEYDADVNKTEAPLILNGGHFEQIVLRRGSKDKTSYIIMGGNFRMKRFTPGYHASNIQGGMVRHCVVNAIGGEYPEFYLSGIYKPDQATRDNDNPHCYTNGGYFGLMAGAGYEQVKGNVTFKIDHSIIGEFYGGGINGAKPVTGNIDVTINNSLVGKYCGGPKVGSMEYDDNGTTKYRTVTTNATGTTFGVFYGGGNGGTSYYRDPKYDNTREFPTTDNEWKTNNGNYTPNFNAFNPLNQESTPNAAYDNSKGYHAEYEFEVFNASNGLKSSDDVIRLYYHWAQFGTTITGNVTNTLTDCIVTGDFFGGGNLANVMGNVTSTLKGTTHVCGRAFAAGYSASIPSFPVHNKSTVRFPNKDKSGNVDEQGSLDYYQDNGKDRMYTWCYKNSSGTVFPEGVVIPAGYSVGAKQKSVFRYPDEDGGKWYVLTNVSLENLGSVSNDATLIIKGNSEIGTIAETDMDLEDGTHVTAGSLIPNTGNVFGGGDQSAVTGNTVVILREGATIHGNVYGGGNNGPVGGNSEVKIQDPEP